MGSFSGLISLLTLIAFAIINIGDKAPTFIEETQWIKGKAPVFENSLTIVELWRSSCSNCRGQIPHLTALQRAYGDRISIVALNSEPIDVLTEFMKEHGDELSYTVGHVSKEVMSLFIEGTPGVPYCYIIDKKGNIIWKGHPSSIEDVLDNILNGSIDAEKMKKIALLEKALNDAFDTNYAAAITQAVKDLLAIDPGNVLALESAINMAKYNKDQGMIKKVFNKAPMSGLAAKNADALAAMLISDDDPSYRYPDIATKFVEHALSKEPENSEYINTYARALFYLGDSEKAIVQQKKALKLEPGNKTYQDNLNLYMLQKKAGTSTTLK
jgi:thiol-disulfide isomerase/thioredoxin